MAFGIDGGAARAGNVKDPLLSLSVSYAGLDHLQPGQGRTLRILACPSQEARGLRPSGKQVSAHRYALRVGISDPVRCARFREVIASKEAHGDAAAGGGEGFFPAKGRVDRFPGVLLSPGRGQAAGAPGAAIGIEIAGRLPIERDGSAFLRLVVKNAGFAPEIVVIAGVAAIVRIARANHTKFEGVEALGLMKL